MIIEKLKQTSLLPRDLIDLRGKQNKILNYAEEIEFTIDKDTFQYKNTYFFKNFQEGRIPDKRFFMSMGATYVLIIIIVGKTTCMSM